MPLLRTLGSEQEARLIYEAKRTPKGWKRLGRGAYRTAYLAPSGVVYKVAMDYYLSDAKARNGKPLTNNNDEEFENYMRIVSKGISYRGWRIPKLYAYTWIDEMSSLRITVNAMEFISGKHDKYSDDPDDWSALDEKVFSRFGLFDCHTGNYVVGDDGRRYIVDLAC